MVGVLPGTVPERTGSRMEFSRFGFTAGGAPGCTWPGWPERCTRPAWSGRRAEPEPVRMSPRLELPRLDRNAWLNLSWPGLGAGLDLPRSRLGRLPRLKPSLRRQLLDLLRHLGGQGHVALAGNAVTARPLACRHRPGLDPGNGGGDLGHISGRRHQVGLIQVGLGHLEIIHPVGRRQAVPLDQSRRDNLLEITMAVDHRTGRHHTVNPGDVGGVPDDSLVDDRPIDVGDPGEVGRRGAHVIVARTESPTAEKSRRVIGRGGVGPG